MAKLKARECVGLDYLRNVGFVRYDIIIGAKQIHVDDEMPMLGLAVPPEIRERCIDKLRAAVRESGAAEDTIAAPALPAHTAQARFVEFEL